MKTLVYRGFEVAANDNQAANTVKHPLVYRGVQYDQKGEAKAARQEHKNVLVYRGHAA